MTPTDLRDTIICELRRFADYHTDPAVFAESNFYEHWQFLHDVPKQYRNNSIDFNLQDIAARLIAENQKHQFYKCEDCGRLLLNDWDCDDCPKDDEEEKEEIDTEVTADDVYWFILDCDWDLDYYSGDIKEDLAQHIIDGYDSELSDDARTAADRIESAIGQDIILELLNAGELQHHNGNLLQDYCETEWELLGEIREKGIENVFSREEIEELIGDSETISESEDCKILAE